MAQKNVWIVTNHHHMVAGVFETEEGAVEGKERIERETYNWDCEIEEWEVE